MRIDKIPGQFGFKALYNDQGAWLLTDSYFLSLEDAQKFFTDRVPSKFVWPVEEDVYSGCIYIPEPEELE